MRAPRKKRDAKQVEKQERDPHYWVKESKYGLDRKE
jgi:hypothetical protein